MTGSDEAIQIIVALPDDTTVTLEVLPTETIKTTKMKIEALRSSYPCEHQTLVHPDGKHYSPHLVLKG